ncbi:MAG: LytR/AlgR family response regulator transcription factor [bacterium]
MTDRPIRTIIVDDEELARQMIKEFLNDHASVEVIAECSSGKQAIETILAMQPDLVFLDIQMPECNGFEVLKNLDRLPAVIFSTAYDKYALQAFEVNAVDYLLKPYDRPRFTQSLQRALTRIQKKEAASEQLLALMNHLQSAQIACDRLWIKESGCLKPLKPEAIDWVEAMDDYACLHVGGEQHLVSQTMRELESKLDTRMFMRIHRSTIVNLERIKELQPLGDGSYQVILKDGTRLSLSRSQAKKLKEKVI